MDMVWVIVCIVGGYIASIYTWPTIRYWVTGAQAEIGRLEAALKALKGG